MWLLNLHRPLSVRGRVSHWPGAHDQAGSAPRAGLTMNDASAYPVFLHRFWGSNSVPDARVGSTELSPQIPTSTTLNLKLNPRAHVGAAGTPPPYNANHIQRWDPVPGPTFNSSVPPSPPPYHPLFFLTSEETVLTRSDICPPQECQ